MRGIYRCNLLENSMKLVKIDIDHGEKTHRIRDKWSQMKNSQFRLITHNKTHICIVF